MPCIHARTCLQVKDHHQVRIFNFSTAATNLNRDAPLTRAGEDGGVHQERVPGGGAHDAVPVVLARRVPRGLDGVRVVRHAVPDGAEVLDDVVHGTGRGCRCWRRRRRVAARPGRRRRGRGRDGPRVRRRVRPPPARRARSVGGRRRSRGVVPRVLGVVVVAAALHAAAEEARGDGEPEKQSNGGPGGELHCRSRSNYAAEEMNSGS